MPEHPQYTMWKARYEAERAQAAERAAWRAHRETDREGWRDAWRTYRTNWEAGLTRAEAPSWWHLRAWWRLFMQAWHPR